MVGEMTSSVKSAEGPGKRSCRLLVAAFGDAGHAFPAIGLARALHERGHEVMVETWERWREPVEALGIEFTAAEEYTTFPPQTPGSTEEATAADAALALVPLMERERFDVVVSDILTLAPALAAERVGLRRATLIPHIYPVQEPGLPFFAFGAVAPRTGVGRRLWRRALPMLVRGLERGRDEMNETRGAVGLEPIDRLHGGISEELALVATFPQLEYPRAWPPHVHVTGPFGFELAYPDVELPDGDEPLVLVAASTAQDPDCRLIRVALEALADEPVRVLATTNGHFPPEPLPAPPANARLVDWLSYSQAMAAADLVICHGGHGTVARALGAGVPLVCVPGRRRHGRDRRSGGMVGIRRDAAVAVAVDDDAAPRDASGARRVVVRDARTATWRLGERTRRVGTGRRTGGATRAGFVTRLTPSRHRTNICSCSRPVHALHDRPMEREQLVAWLKQGLSLDRIATLAGRHPSTVSYWLKKYDLVPNGRAKHAAKGGLERHRLAELVAEGRPIRAIADALSVSPSTVRHWLDRYELSQPIEVRHAATEAAKTRGDRTVTRDCIRHGTTVFVIETSGRVRCRRCRIEAFDRRPPSRGREMRAPMRKLPCRGGGRSR